jgi:hypothetical protein
VDSFFSVLCEKAQAVQVTIILTGVTVQVLFAYRAKKGVHA